MGISLRHHVLSLVAAFLMLLVGLLVGVGLSSEPGLQQSMDELSDKFGELSRENSELQEVVERQERFARAVLPQLVTGRLEGQLIPLITTARGRKLPDGPAIAETLQAAGAKVPYRLTLSSDFAEDAVAAYGGDVNAACEEAAHRIAVNVSEADVDGLEVLKKRKLLRIDDEVPRQVPTAVVILGGADGPLEATPDLIDRPLIETLLASGLQVVGCEDSPEFSYIETYRELDIPTVDNVGLARGRFSLVMILSGHPGDYGDGRGAQEFPDIKP
ncbi:MAG: copper transporter [Candidatus Zipacnadales bacterium]